MHAAAADSERSLPLCGGGWGRGVAVVLRRACLVAATPTPNPNPSPQGGGEQIVLAA